MSHIDIIKVRDLMRTIAAASAVVLATGAGSAFAQIDTDGFNTTTGANSVNENTYDITDDVEIDIINSADTDDVLDVDVVTGDNEVDSNTTVGDINGGDIRGEIAFETETNAGGMVDLGLEALEIDADFVNDTTGSSSENTNTLDYSRDVAVTVTNSADVDTTVDADLNTGGNTVTNNTTVGDVSGGDIDLSMEFVTETNAGGSGVDLSGVANTSLTSDLVNDTTGANSENTNTVTVDNNVDVNVTNVSDVINSYSVVGGTGNNTTSNNTTVGDVSTGSIDLTFRSINRINQ